MLPADFMYSVVVPIYNEAGTVRELHERLTAVMRSLNEPFELIFVDDGSTDETVSLLADLKPATVLTFRKNFGQTAALDAGIKHATGEIIITLDGDLQNPPEEIPKLLTALKEQDVDVISGWRAKRKDTVGKKIVSRGANSLRALFINDGIHDSGCTLKAYRRKCFESIDLHGEIHRFIPGILRWQGFSIGEIKVEHALRTSGKTKYSSKRILKGFIDMVGVWFWRKYSSRPLHLFGGGGLLLTGLGGMMLVVLAVARIAFKYPLSTSIWPLIGVLCVLLGILFVITGLLADMIAKQYYTGDRKAYSIKTISKQ